MTEDQYWQSFVLGFLIVGIVWTTMLLWHSLVNNEAKRK
jgi:hypothetical protein